MTQDEIDTAITGLESDTHDDDYSTAQKVKKETDDCNRDIKALIAAWWIMGVDVKGRAKLFRDIEKRVSEMESTVTDLISGRISDVAANNVKAMAGMLAVKDTDIPEIKGLFDPWTVNDITWKESLERQLAAFSVKIQRSVMQRKIFDDTPDNAEKSVDNYSKPIQRNMISAITTESSRAQSLAALAVFTAAGVDKFRFKAILDSRTSRICRSMNGRVFPMSQWKVGVNVPPLHTHCRSRVIPIID